jgi:hypothetical protein
VRARLSRILIYGIVGAWTVVFFCDRLFLPNVPFMDRVAFLAVATVAAALLAGLAYLVLGPPE